MRMPAAYRWSRFTLLCQVWFWAVTGDYSADLDAFELESALLGEWAHD